MPAAMKEIIKLGTRPNTAPPSMSPNVPQETTVGNADPTSFSRPFPAKFPFNPESWLELPAWYVVGEATYRDVYSNHPHRTKFCGVIANVYWFSKDRDVQIGFCGVGNGMD
jgi:hypothetical protein